MNVAEFPDASDTSDEDYVPNGRREDIPSEIDSNEDPEESLSDSENPNAKEKKRNRKATKTKKKVKNDCQKSGSSKENEHNVEENLDKKQNIDDLWADFMKDTGFRPKNLSVSKPKENNISITQIIGTSKKELSQKPPEKVKVTQIFEFAGEEVKVEKEVAVNSAEARLLEKIHDEKAPKTRIGKRSGSLIGISDVLSQLGKKPKISTLEKSKLDWEKFKKEENIEEELQTYNKGKDGFLERQDFLQRADLRRFEIEKDIRTVERNKRFNSTL